MISYFAGLFGYEYFFSSILILLTNLNDIQYVRLNSRYRGPGLEFAKEVPEMRIWSISLI